MKKFLLLFLFVLTIQLLSKAEAINSIETGYTIMQTRIMSVSGTSYIIGTSYEGTIVCYNYDGEKQWENKLSGFMNHDINCADIDGDGKDEVLAANANGYVYAIDDDGTNLWNFSKNDAPMNAVCMVSKNETNYIVCGGFDMYVYYLSPTDGTELKRFHSSTYGVDKQGGEFKHTMNFMRRIQQNDKDVLVIHSALNTNWAQGSLYLFHPYEEKPFKTITISANNSVVYGSFAVNDILNGSTEIILGGNNLKELKIAVANAESGTSRKLETQTTSKDCGKAGYRMATIQTVPNGDSFLYYVHFGNRMFVVSPDKNVETEIIEGKFAFNNMSKDSKTGKLLLASAQSGGSCIHVLDYSNPTWKSEFENLVPPGKITSIIYNTANFKSKLISGFTKPEWEREAVELFVLDGGVSASDENDLTALNANCPKFVSGAGIYPHCENWDRSGLTNAKYRDKRDGRKKYDYTADQVFNTMTGAFNDAKHGIQYWGGHGSDPMYYSLATIKRVIDAANGKVMIPVFAELESYDNDFKWMMDNYMYPLAEYFKTRNGLISLRNKHLFWQSIVHTNAWERLTSGEFADVFVSSMEESNSKTMDMSVSGRMGLWATGAMNRWGTRFTRDNPCYDRLRQLSYQRLPNHYLRMFVYNIASGASVIHNTVVDSDYTSVIWYMLAKGILFVPKREEIVSFNPVHLSMIEPHELFLDGNHVKVTTEYIEGDEQTNPRIVGHTSGAWPGAPVSDWDFSKFATGGNERRMEFLPPYPNGMVLTTPLNNESNLRGTITDHLHPIYKNITEEVIMDGVNYYSNKNKSTTYKADTYGPTVANKIKEKAQKLPLTVEGRVAWVTAQTAPKHLRLTLVDGGYVNPDDRTVTISFHTAKVKKIINLINDEEISFSGNKATVNVPCGLFTFLDIELEEALKVEGDTTSSPKLKKNNIKVIGGDRNVKVIGAQGKNIKMVNLSGQLVCNVRASNTQELIPSKAGIMLVSIEGDVHKVFVR